MRTHKGKALAALGVAMALIGHARPAEAQGIPVYDATNYAQTLATVENTLKMITQGEQVIATAQQQLASLQQLTNVNAIASSLASSAERNILPAGTTNMTALVTGDTASLGALGTQAQQLQAGWTIPTSGNASLDQQYNQLIQQVTGPAATRMALGASMLTTFQQRTNDLQMLQNALNTANDPKQTMDLNARIAAEQTQLQNDMLKIEAIKMSQQAKNEAGATTMVAAIAAASSASLQNQSTSQGQ